jgi:hypothetical protein
MRWLEHKHISERLEVHIKFHTENINVSNYLETKTRRNNIETNSGEIGCADVGWIQLVQNSTERWVFVNAVTQIPFSQNQILYLQNE